MTDAAGDTDGFLEDDKAKDGLSRPDNGLVPTTNIYVTTGYLASRGIETKRYRSDSCRDVPFSADEDRPDAVVGADACLP